jgi:hypothetical protein
VGQQLLMSQSQPQQPPHLPTHRRQRPLLPARTGPSPPLGHSDGVHTLPGWSRGWNGCNIGRCGGYRRRRCMRGPWASPSSSVGSRHRPDRPTSCGLLPLGRQPPRVCLSVLVACFPHSFELSEWLHRTSHHLFTVRVACGQFSSVQCHTHLSGCGCLTVRSGYDVTPPKGQPIILRWWPPPRTCLQGLCRIPSRMGPLGVAYRWQPT